MDKVLDTGKKHKMVDTNEEICKCLKDADTSINMLEDSGIDVTDLQKELSSIRTDNENTQEKKEVLSNLRKLLRKIALDAAQAVTQ